MYYDVFNSVTVSDKEFASMGLEDTPKERLAELGIYKLVINKPEIEDTATQGLAPAGPPFPSADDPYTYVQEMVIFNFLDRFKEQKIAELADRRWQAQCANLIFEDGTIFKTTPDDITRLSTLLQTLQAAGSIEVDFKAASGWITASVDTLKDAYDTIAIYIEACFSHERQLAEAIEKVTNLDELNAIDIMNGWPPNAPEYEPPQEDETPDNPEDETPPEDKDNPPAESE